MNSRPRQAVSSFRPPCAALFLMLVKSGRAGVGYETTLSVLKYIEVEFEMVKNFLLLYQTMCVRLSDTFANIDQSSNKNKLDRRYLNDKIKN